MAYLFGIQTAHGVANLVANSVSTNKAVETAEVRDETGKVSEEKAYSKKTTITVKGSVTADVTIKAGDSMTSGGVTYIVDSVDKSETNTGFVEVSVSAHTADSATITPLTTSASV